MLEYDVAIIGCGPVGGIAANLLGKAGVRTLVVERAAEPHPLPRAVHIDHEIMRVLQNIGLTDVLGDRVRDTQGHLHIGADRGVIRYLGTAGRPRPFGWSNDYFFYQPELEQVLREGLDRFASVTLQLGTALTGLTQDADGATLTLGTVDASSTVRARYVIACDGASSPVRKLLEVALDDLDFDEPWLVVDAEVSEPLAFPAFLGVPEGADLQQLSIMLCDPDRPTTVVPGRGNHRRWEFMLLPGEDETMMQADTITALIAPWVEGRPHRIVRAATYRFHGLIAERWKTGSVFLAGDAAHQTPPFFGQGMCHGVRDVANLAWKLELVLNERASPALLDDYQSEREPQVRSVIASAVEAGRYICMLDPDRAAERDRTMRQRASDPVRTAADLITPIRGRTGSSAAAGVRFIQPQVRRGDDTFLMDDVTGAGFVLVQRPGASVPKHPVIKRLGLKVVTLGDEIFDISTDLIDWLDAQGADAVVVRPDFYVFDIASKDEPVIALLDRLDACIPLQTATAETITPCPV